MPEEAVFWISLPGDVLKIAPVLRHEFGQFLHNFPDLGVLRRCGASGNWKAATQWQG